MKRESELSWHFYLSFFHFVLCMRDVCMLRLRVYRDNTEINARASVDRDINAVVVVSSFLLSGRSHMNAHMCPIYQYYLYGRKTFYVY